MSEVQRYSPIGDGVAKTDINGMLVAYEDYMIVSTRKEQLKAEVEELRKELAESQENYHLVNKMVAKILKEGK